MRVPFLKGPNREGRERSPFRISFGISLSDLEIGGKSSPEIGRKSGRGLVIGGLVEGDCRDFPRKPGGKA